MSTAVFLLVLFGAALHATWNAVIKHGSDTARRSLFVAVFAAVIAGCGLPFVPAPAPASWPFAAASVVLQVIYWMAVAESYRIADMSRAYPLMRGTAPLLVASVSITMFGEPLSVPIWIGVAMISAGILALAATPGARGGHRGTATALATAGIIAAYTIIDGVGVRRSGSALGYTAWIFLLTAIPLVAREVLRDPSGFRRLRRSDLGYGLVGGVGTLASYGIEIGRASCRERVS
jgi:drug/metabolite transporter (DMT)-like permease